MKPQFFQGITREDYVSLCCEDGELLENQSKAKSAIHSAWKYWMDHMNPDRPMDGPTDYMVRGSLVHEIALEDKKNFASFDGARRGRKWEDFKLKCEKEDLLPVTKDSGIINERDLLGCAASVKEAMEELGAGEDQECAIVFEQNGIKCKALLDKLSHDLVIHDLKVTDKIGKDEFMYHAFDLGWDYQAVWYKRSVKAMFDLPHDPEFYFVTVQPTYPYEWSYHVLHGNALDVAERRVDKSLENLRVARETGDWSHVKRTANLVDAPLKFYDTED